MNTYEIRKKLSDGTFLGPYEVFVNDENMGEIQPRYKTMNSDRPYAYWTEVRLEWDALTDDTGFPNEYRTLKEAKEAVADMMQRNGIDPA